MKPEDQVAFETWSNGKPIWEMSADEIWAAACAHRDAQPAGAQELRYTADRALAECPCCGSLDVGGVHDTVNCYGCGLTVTAPRPLQNAINKWNQRTNKAPAPAGVQGEPITVLPDGSAFAVMSFPLPKDHWLYAERQYQDGEYEPVELGKPILTHAVRDAVVSAVRYAVRGATNCGKDVDFDPDALVQNAVYALCGPYSKPKPKQDEFRAPAVAQPPVCQTCNGNGRIGGPSYYAPDEGGVPCPDCNHPPADVVRELVEALDIAVCQNSHDMVMTGEELRRCEAALKSAKEHGL